MPACFDEATALKRRRRLRPATNHQTNQRLNAAVATSSKQQAAAPLGQQWTACTAGGASAFPRPLHQSQNCSSITTCCVSCRPPNCCPSLGIPCHSKACAIVSAFPAHPGRQLRLSVQHPAQSGQAKPPSLMPRSPITYRLSCLNHFLALWLASAHSLPLDIQTDNSIAHLTSSHLT